MILEKLAKKKLIHPPDWLINNLQFLTQMGSHTYGTSQNDSDIDFYGIVVPRRDMVFPHLAGVIKGFGDQGKSFDQYQQHHVKDEEVGKEYDFTIISIVKVFELARQGNPNILDMMFVPETCIAHSTQIGNLIRENRKEFLSKQCFKRFKGYAYSQIKLMENKEPVGKRKDRVEEFGYDTKYAMHLVRLLSQAEQILATHDMDLQLNREQHKAIRRGEWTKEQVLQFFHDKERQLEELYVKSTLRVQCDERKLKELLMNCLEIHYGDLSKCVSIPNEEKYILNEIAQSIDRARARNLI